MRNKQKWKDCAFVHSKQAIKRLTLRKLLTSKRLSTYVRIRQAFEAVILSPSRNHRSNDNMEPFIRCCPAMTTAKATKKCCFRAMERKAVTLS